MRVLFIAFSLISTLIIQHTVQAQCNIFNPAVKLNSSTTNTANGGCDINLDLYFDMQSNSGGKYVYVHIWPKAHYPTLTYSNPPSITQLTNAVATLGFYHFGGSLYMLNSYSPDPTIPNFKFTGINIIKSAGSTTGSIRFTIQNITLNSQAGCGLAQEFTADVWQSQSASAQNVHCFSRGLNFFANDPRITGFMICEPPRQYRFQIRTIDPAGIIVNYKVYIDNGDGVYNSATDNIEIANGSNIPLNSTNNYTFSSPLLGYLPYSNQKPEGDRALWIVVSSPTRDNTSLARLDNNCALLPVQLGEFNVRWSGDLAQLEWTTLTEIDNRGFEIERKNNGDDLPFRTIGFTPSQATQGNSTDELNYSFLDPSPIRTAVQYRIKQMDHSGKTSYSPVRSLSPRNLISQIHPNPANDQVNVIFSKKQSSYWIEWVNDAGQKMGQWNGRDRLTIQTSSFPNGTNRIKITDKQTGQTETRTILIQHQQ
jgi:hypothetical protein